MHNLGNSVILADERNFYISYIYLMSLGMELPYNINADTIQLLHCQRSWGGICDHQWSVHLSASAQDYWYSKSCG